MTNAALITGSSDRIGKAIALALADSGFNIALHYHSSDQKAIQTKNEILEKQVQCELFKADLSNRLETKELITSVFKKFRITVLINNASLFIPDKLIDCNDALFDQLFQTNFKAPYLLIREFANIAKKGIIINLLDTNIIRNKTAHFDYLLTKKFLHDLTGMAASELAPDIRVNGIAPGLILPPVDYDHTYLERLSKNIPLKKPGNVKNISDTVLFLINNDFITGQVIYVDGGENL
jgi:NAD(P)-dependent dehydrogenase (short-subunit alcohol dehydrogenase family)